MTNKMKYLQVEFNNALEVKCNFQYVGLIKYTEVWVTQQTEFLQIFTKVYCIQTI